MSFQRKRTFRGRKGRTFSIARAVLARLIPAGGDPSPSWRDRKTAMSAMKVALGGSPEIYIDDDSYYGDEHVRRITGVEDPWMWIEKSIKAGKVVPAHHGGYSVYLRGGRKDLGFY